MAILDRFERRPQPPKPLNAAAPVPSVKVGAAPTDLWNRTVGSRPVMGSPTVLGSGGGGSTGSSGGTSKSTSSLPPPPYVTSTTTSGGSGGTGGTGGTGGATVPATGGLSLTAAPSTEMTAALAEWKKRMEALQAQAGTVDPNLTFGIEEYKKRLNSDDTRRATDRAASAIRDQLAGLQETANVVGARTGRGQGIGAEGLAEAGQRALAGQAADIQMGQQRRLDSLALGGMPILSAPGQQQLAYQNLLGSMYGQNPYEAQARLGLSQQQLGLQAYLGQLQAQNEAARTNAQLYGSPWQMYQLLLGQI